MNSISAEDRALIDAALAQRRADGLRRSLKLQPIGVHDAVYRSPAR